MTPEQLADILAKADAVHAAKTAYDTAVGQYNTAVTSAQNAEQEWNEGVNEGEDEATLETLVTAYVTAAVTEAQKEAAVKAAKTPYDEASNALAAATKAVIDETVTPP